MPFCSLYSLQHSRVKSYLNQTCPVIEDVPEVVLEHIIEDRKFYLSASDAQVRYRINLTEPDIEHFIDLHETALTVLAVEVNTP